MTCQKNVLFETGMFFTQQLQYELVILMWKGEVKATGRILVQLQRAVPAAQI